MLQNSTKPRPVFHPPPGGTTAAKRFFGKLPDPLFDYLLVHLEPTPRPARRRPRQKRQSYLQPIGIRGGGPTDDRGP